MAYKGKANKAGRVKLSVERARWVLMVSENKAHQFLEQQNVFDNGKKDLRGKKTCHNNFLLSRQDGRNLRCFPIPPNSESDTTQDVNHYNKINI